MKKIEAKKEKSVKSKKGNKGIIIGAAVICVSLCAVAGYFIGNAIRTSKINKQALNYINADEKVSTIYCSGKNIRLSQEAYSLIKDSGLDLVISNNKFVEKIASENVEQKFDVVLNTTSNANYAEAYDISIGNNGVKELKIKLDSDKQYFSEFVGEEFITNKVVVEDGLASIQMKDDNTVYTLAYIVPEDIVLEDVKVNKGASKDIEMGIEKKDYTFGSVELKANTETGIEIEGFKIKGVEVGEYVLTAVMPNGNKEAKVMVEPSVEKIDLDKLSVELFRNDNTTINATFTPDNAVNKALEWKSTNEGIAKVDENGTVTGVAEGTCEIICTTKD